MVLREQVLSRDDLVQAGHSSSSAKIGIVASWKRDRRKEYRYKIKIKKGKEKRNCLLQPAVEEEEREKNEFGRKYFRAKSFCGAPLFLFSVNQVHRRDFPKLL